MWLNWMTVKARPLWQLYWDLSVHGAVDAIPGTGPLIVAANHTCFLDPWYLSILFPRELHHLINRDWYERSWAWRSFFRANGTVPVEPQDPQATIRAVREKLDRGLVVCVFPEGRISRDGKIQRFRSGVAWIAAGTGAPVVPLGLRGAFETLPERAGFPNRGAVQLHVGEPRVFPGSPVEGEPAPRAVIRFRRELFDTIRRLSGQSEPESGSVDPQSSGRAVSTAG